MMDRLQKKCFFGAALLHGLLLLIVIFGTAFFTSKQPVSSAQIVEIIPNATVTDGKTGGGNPVPTGNPNPTPPAPTPKPEVIPPKPEPQPERQPVVEPPKVQPVEKDQESEVPVVVKKQQKPLPKPVVKPVAKKPTVDISKPIVRNPRDKKSANEEAEKIARQTAEREAKRVAAKGLAALNSAVQNIQKNLSGATTIETGTGGSGGGAAEINYADLVLSKYDEKWIAPNDVDENEAIVKVKVVIARNGSVSSAQITRPSRNASLDGSVRRALDSVKFIAPFPAGSSDSQRTYIINFNLKSKRGIG